MKIWKHSSVVIALVAITVMAGCDNGSGGKTGNEPIDSTLPYLQGSVSISGFAEVG
jgi:hypothetical protein